MEFRLCCAGRHADDRAVAQLVSAVRAIRGGGVCLGSGYRAEPASRGEGFLLYFGAVRIGSGIFYLNPCTVGEMVFWWVGMGEGELLAGTFREPRGAVLRWFFGWWFEFAVRLSFLVWLLHRGKKKAVLGL